MSSLNQLPPVSQELLSELELTDNDPQHTTSLYRLKSVTVCFCPQRALSGSVPVALPTSRHAGYTLASLQGYFF